MSEYNFLYKRLVQGPNDVAGALAYALYKAEKVAYIAECERKNGGPATDEDLQAFHLITNTSVRIEAYQNQAQELVRQFLTDILAQQLAQDRLELRQEYLAVAVDDLKEHAKATRQDLLSALAEKNSMWRGVWQNVIAGLVTMLLTFGFVLAVWMWEVGPNQILFGAWQKYIQQAPTPADKSSPTP